MSESLTEAERRLLDFERAHGALTFDQRARRAWQVLGYSRWRYLQILTAMVASPDPVYRAYAPQVVGRLDRQLDYTLRRGGGAHRKHAADRTGEDRPQIGQAG